MSSFIANQVKTNMCFISVKLFIVHTTFVSLFTFVYYSRLLMTDPRQTFNYDYDYDLRLSTWSVGLTQPYKKEDGFRRGERSCAHNWTTEAFPA